MGVLKISRRVCRKVLNLNLSKLAADEGGYYYIRWLGPDVTIAFNAMKVGDPKKGRKRPATCAPAEGLLYAESGFGFGQYFLDTGLYSHSLLRSIYVDEDPPVDPLEELPRSKYVQPKDKTALDRPRCLLAQCIGDKSIDHTDGAFAEKYLYSVQEVLKRYKDEIVIKAHPKAAKSKWWPKISRRLGVPLLYFSTEQLADFDQVIAWSSTALLEGPTTDLVQLAHSGLGSFVKCRTACSFEDIDTIQKPDADLIESRMRRLNWLYNTFCRKRFLKQRLNIFDFQSSDQLDELQAHVEWVQSLKSE